MLKFFDHIFDKGLVAIDLLDLYIPFYDRIHMMHFLLIMQILQNMASGLVDLIRSIQWLIEMNRLME